MDSPMIRATWQAAILSALSNVLGQAIRCYQSNEPFQLNVTDFTHFVLFTIMSCPPNFVWQGWLEQQFPGYTAKRLNEKKTDGKGASTEKSINITNTAIKFALDMTLGATVNTILFIGGIDLMRGNSIGVAATKCREQFWPLIFAGLKLWPAVSILNFTLVPVQYRVVVGSIVGLFWGVYLSLVSSSGK